MLYFTSDLHFGHENILKWRKGFGSLAEMDATLIRNWNETVSANDTVIVTGDLLFRNEKPAVEYLQQLKGKKILVKGNHDGFWMKKYKNAEISSYFEGIYDFYTVKKDKVRLRFCHYPMISWEGAQKGCLFICGHIHDRRDDYEFETFRQIPLAFNAGTDINRFRPVPLSALIANNLAFYERENTPEERQMLEKAIQAYG